MNRSQYIISLFEYGSDGESKFRHKVAGAALGLGGLGVAALATHAATKGQSLGASLGDLGHGVSNWGKAHNFSTAPKAGVTTPTGSGATTFQGYGVKTTTTPSGVTTPYGSSTGSPKAPVEAPKFTGGPTTSVSPMSKTPTTSAPAHMTDPTTPKIQSASPTQSPGATQTSPEPPKAPGAPGQVRQDTRGLGPTELVKKPEPDEAVRARGQEVYDRIKAHTEKMKNLQGGLENVGKGMTTSTGTTQVDQHVKDHAYYTRPATGRNWGYQLP